jgi:membrane protein YqaA with SNARE-associated domain
MVVSTTVIPVPTPPIILYAGHFFSPIMVAVVGGLASSIGCLLDYIIIGYTTDLKQFSKYKDHRFTVKLRKYFEKNGFFTLMFFALTPLPFEPVKVLAIISKYDVRLYALAISISRGIRYYVLASVGSFLSLTQILLFVIVVVILFIANHLKKYIRKPIRETAE